MMMGMRQRILRWFFGVMGVVMTASSALGSREPEYIPLDGRLEGYLTNVTLKGGGTALVYLLLVFLTAICFVGLFRNARRSHLD